MNNKSEVIGKLHNYVAFRLKADITRIINFENKLEVKGIECKYVDHPKEEPFNGCYILFDIIEDPARLKNTLIKYKMGRVQERNVPLYGSKVIFVE